MNEEERNFILRFARETIENYIAKNQISKPNDYPSSLDEKKGVFCTIKKNEKLRGCIGIVYPLMPLIDALIDAACGVCRDPRFPALCAEETKDIKIEISILTEPSLLRKQDYERIKIGEDGLIINYGPYSGLLLPQVASEHKWSYDQFLENLCLKAGLDKNMWREADAKIYRFEAEIISE